MSPRSTPNSFSRAWLCIGFLVFLDFRHYNNNNNNPYLLSIKTNKNGRYMQIALASRGGCLITLIDLLAKSAFHLKLPMIQSAEYGNCTYESFFLNAHCTRQNRSIARGSGKSSRHIPSTVHAWVLVFWWYCTWCTRQKWICTREISSSSAILCRLANDYERSIKILNQICDFHTPDYFFLPKSCWNISSKHTRCR